MFNYDVKKSYEAYYIFKIMAMMFMKWYDMWKAISHIMMMDPLWSLMLRVIPMIMTLCGYMLKKEDVYVHDSLFWLKLLCFLWCLWLLKFTISSICSLIF